MASVGTERNRLRVALRGLRDGARTKEAKQVYQTLLDAPNLDYDLVRSAAAGLQKLAPIDEDARADYDALADLVGRLPEGGEA